MEEKFCLRCQRMKPIEDFGPSSTTPDGKQSWCRECINLYARLNVEHKAVGGVKLCRVCREIKPKTEFYSCASYKDGLQTICKECDKEHGKLKRADGYLKEANTDNWQELGLLMGLEGAAREYPNATLTFNAGDSNKSPLTYPVKTWLSLLKDQFSKVEFFPTEELIAELKKRGYEGELRITKTVKI